MVLVLGAETYIGRIFCAELRRRGREYLLPSARDCYDLDSLFNCVLKARPDFIINVMGGAGKGANINEPASEEVLRANTILPRCLSQVCLMTNTPWAHISSCAIYLGAKVMVSPGVLVGKKIARAELLHLIQQCPEKLRGFTEADDPNFSFHAAPCNFFSGTMALAEEVIHGIGRNYIWRIGLPFDESNEPGNFLHQILDGKKIYDGVNPLSHTHDFVNAGLNLWERGASYGTYNIANPGILTTAQIAEMASTIIKPSPHFEYWHDDAEFYSHGNPSLRSHCLLDVSKLLAMGVPMRPAAEAIEDSLKSWHANAIHDDLHRAAA
jgi:dTDP-4-dehydrorhamnose reductase